MIAMDPDFVGNLDRCPPKKTGRQPGWREVCEAVTCRKRMGLLGQKGVVRPNTFQDVWNVQ